MLPEIGLILFGGLLILFGSQRYRGSGLIFLFNVVLKIFQGCASLTESYA